MFQAGRGLGGGGRTEQQQQKEGQQFFHEKYEEPVLLVRMGRSNEVPADSRRF
jgi:hypothetical protein